MTTEHLGTAHVYVSERDSMFVYLQNPYSSARSHFNGVYFEVGENSQIPGSLTMTNAGPSSIICILMQFPPASWGADSLDMVFPLRLIVNNWLLLGAKMFLFVFGGRNSNKFSLSAL